jgi:hypothetical protein
MVMAPVDLQTKQCPFCAETIQAGAIKCRFCGEFLNSPKAKALVQKPQEDPQTPEGEPASDEFPITCGPSMLSLAPDFLKALGVFFLGVLLVMLRLEKLIDALPGVNLTPAQASVFASYRVVIALGLFLSTAVFLGIKIAKVRTTYYEISADRIEWGRGIFDKKIDNLDMFRIIDIKLRRTGFDLMLGIGSIVLTTTDKSDPEFTFESIRNPRGLYDVIKKISLQADRRGSVVHLE